MILNTGSRTDIPAFYSDWFYHRVKEGFVYIRNPYYPKLVTHYKINPQVVDCITFCTKNPQPMLARLNELNSFSTFWFVSINPYEREIEPYVPEIDQVIDSFKMLSQTLGKNQVEWRYDPIFITSKYSIEFHINAFEYIARKLEGFTNACTISFIDLYEKTKKNFPYVREVSQKEKELIISNLVQIGRKYQIVIKTCLEGHDFTKFGVNSTGCMSKTVIENAIRVKLNPVHMKYPRVGCKCLLGHDIGVYNSCGHLCVYCYANNDKKTVVTSMKNHNIHSPFLIGELLDGDVIKEANQRSYLNKQITIFDLLG